jgi:hypothetical protein
MPDAHAKGKPIPRFPASRRPNHDTPMTIVARIDSLFLLGKGEKAVRQR